jgi:hypothetical protein
VTLHQRFIGRDLAFVDGIEKLFIAEHELLALVTPEEFVVSLPDKIPGAITMRLLSGVRVIVQYDMSAGKSMAVSAQLQCEAK